MVTKVNIIRGKATIDEIKAKKFNIYLGISLGNKWFTKENIKEYLIWALKYTKEKVGVLVADTLHSVNYEVRNNISPEKAKTKAIKQGDGICKIIQEVIGEFSKEDQEKIIIIRWDEIVNTKTNEKSKKIFEKKFKEDPKFKEGILRIIREYTSHDKQKKFSDAEIEKLATYILNELPEILHGYEIKGVYFNVYIYPQDSILSEFVDKIQKKEIFPELHNQIENIDANTFVELKVE